MELVRTTFIHEYSVDNPKSAFSPAGLLDIECQWRPHWRHQIHALSSGFYPSSAYYAQFVRSLADAESSTVDLLRFSVSISPCLLRWLKGFPILHHWRLEVTEWNVIVIIVCLLTLFCVELLAEDHSVAKNRSIESLAWL
jgi:hypothetical protein